MTLSGSGFSRGKQTRVRRETYKTKSFAGVVPDEGDSGPGILGDGCLLVLSFLDINTENLHSHLRERSIYLAEKLKIIPLGGLDEIGKNITVLEYGRT